MIDWLVIMFILMAVLFLFAGIEKTREKDLFWGFVFILVSTVMWFILAASILETETTYEMFNATSGNIETGIHRYTSKTAPEMVYFFQMMAIVSMIFSIVIAFLAAANLFKERKNRLE